MASTVLPNGIIIPEKYSRDWYADLYHNWQELDNLLGGGTPKDGTLTIQKNGATVGTFSANQATNETINITVPTKTSDLTNDSGFITSDNTKIPLAGSNQISGDLVPSTDGTVNLGGSSYQWNQAYIKSLTINGVACGDILTHNASEFVDVSSNQTIGGVKTFSNGDKTFNDSAPLRIQGCNKGNEFSNNARTVLEIRSNRDTADKSCIYITKFRQNRAQGSMGSNDNVILTMDVLENEVRTNDLLRFTAHNWINDVPTEMYLEPTTKVSNIQSYLGSPSRPWGNTTTNAINGINPGALSLPSTSTGYVDIKSTIGQYLKDNNTNIYEFTAPFDGWVCVGIVKGSLRVDNIIRNISNGSENLGYWCSYTIPFRKDDVIQIKINKMDPADDYVNDIMWKAYIYPCQGNV